jgi:hypothetical protein
MATTRERRGSMTKDREQTNDRSRSKVLEPADDVPALTDEQEAGIQAAIESLREGKGVALDEAKARIDRILAPPRSPT